MRPQRVWACSALDPLLPSPASGMTQVCLYIQIGGESFVEFQLKSFKALRGVGRDLCTLWGESGRWGLRGRGAVWARQALRALQCGGCHFNWAFVCQQPTLALLSRARVLRARVSGQDEGPAGREMSPWPSWGWERNSPRLSSSHEPQARTWSQGAPFSGPRL